MVFTVHVAYSGLKVGQVMEAAIPISILAIGLARVSRRASTFAVIGEPCGDGPAEIMRGWGVRAHEANPAAASGHGVGDGAPLGDVEQTIAGTGLGRGICEQGCGLPRQGEDLSSSFLVRPRNTRPLLSRSPGTTHTGCL